MCHNVVVVEMIRVFLAILKTTKVLCIQDNIYLLEKVKGQGRGHNSCLVAAQKS